MVEEVKGPAGEPSGRSWKTVSRRDPEFGTYLDGSFSSTERALPVRSLNVDTVSEEVTFQIVPVSVIDSPGLLQITWQLLRPSALVLSIGPMLATLFLLRARGLEIQGVIAFSSFVGVLLFQASVNLFNDYSDHVKGQDRLKMRSGGRAIQKGWVRARDVKYAASILAALAVLCGLPAIVLHFSPLALVAVAAGLAGFALASQSFGLKYRGFGEVIAFALTGPLLTSGYVWALTGLIPLEFFSLGCIFGAISLMYFHLVNFENIMVDGQAGIRTWATRTGFDASKKFFFFTAFLVLGLTAAFMVFFAGQWRLLPVLAAQAVVLVPLARRVQGLASPLSSDLVGIRAEALKLSWLTVVVLVASLLVSFLAPGAVG